jgi:hypothetical protein
MLLELVLRLVSLGCVLPFLVIGKSEMSCINGNDCTDIKNKLDLVLKIYLGAVGK